MKKVFPIYKRRGETPLHVIHRLKRSHADYAQETISYAGRLDPMAEGLLLLLVGDENKKRESYENMEKVYTFTILFGITTDTYDVLGKIQKVEKPLSQTLLQSKLQQILPTFLGNIEQPYPPYSSFHINKKPLFYWAREGRLAEITVPTKLITIHSLTLDSLSTIPLSELGKTIISDIQKVKGNFRQEAIIQDWENALSHHPHLSLPTATLTTSCTSGTYVRSLAHQIGKIVGCGALALRIERTRVGTFSLSQANNLNLANDRDTLTRG